MNNVFFNLSLFARVLFASFEETSSEVNFFSIDEVFELIIRLFEK